MIEEVLNVNTHCLTNRLRWNINMFVILSSTYVLNQNYQKYIITLHFTILPIIFKKRNLCRYLDICLYIINRWQVQTSIPPCCVCVVMMMVQYGPGLWPVMRQLWSFWQIPHIPPTVHYDSQMGSWARLRWANKVNSGIHIELFLQLKHCKLSRFTSSLIWGVFMVGYISSSNQNWHVEAKNRK